MRRTNIKYPIQETVKFTLTWTCKPLKKQQVVVHVSKDKINPRRILGGNHQHHAAQDAQDAPCAKTKTINRRNHENNGRRSVTQEKWMGITKFCV